MRIYLAGPMTGYPKLNHPLFHSEAERLRRLGYDVGQQRAGIWADGVGNGVRK